MGEGGLGRCISDALQTRPLPAETSATLQLDDFKAFKFYGKIYDHRAVYGTFMFNRELPPVLEDWRQTLVEEEEEAERELDEEEDEETERMLNDGQEEEEDDVRILESQEDEEEYERIINEAEG